MRTSCEKTFTSPRRVVPSPPGRRGRTELARVAFTSHLREVAPTGPADYPGATLREVIAAIGSDYPRLGGYLLDDQGRLRKHVAIFVDGTLRPRESVLSLPLTSASDVYVFQALSGG